MSYHDQEYGHQQQNWEDCFSEKSIRQGFIRKVYSILSVQLIISFGFVLAFNNHPELKSWSRNNYWLFIVALGVSICTILPMVCVQSLRRKTPINFILLGTFTLAQAVILGFVGAFTKPEIIQLAVAITAVIVLGLTVFAFQTKWDFTLLNGAMFIILLCFTIFGFIMMFFKGHIINLIYASIGALIFSMYIIIDTQQIVGGKNNKYQVSPEEYIFGALMLYIDIINLFTFILQILNEANK